MGFYTFMHYSNENAEQVHQSLLRKLNTYHGFFLVVTFDTNITDIFNHHWFTNINNIAIAQFVYGEGHTYKIYTHTIKKAIDFKMVNIWKGDRFFIDPQNIYPTDKLSDIGGRNIDVSCK